MFGVSVSVNLNISFLVISSNTPSTSSTKRLDDVTWYLRFTPKSSTTMLPLTSVYCTFVLVIARANTFPLSVIA